MSEDLTSTSRAQRLARQKRRRRVRRVAALVVAIGFGVLAAVLWLQDDDGGDTEVVAPPFSEAPSSSSVPSPSTESPATSNGSEPSSAASEEPSTPETPAPAPDRRGSGESVTFAFGGDSHFESFLATQLEADPVGMLAAIAPALSEADIAMVNLETAVTEGGEPAPKEFTFRAPASALTALSSAGVDVVSLANNHGLDYGVEGIESARAASVESGLPVIGIGSSAEEAFAPFRTTVGGQRIAIIAATQVLDTALISSWTATDDQGGLASAKDTDALVAAVARARADSDTVVVFLHWGVSLETCPSDAQRVLAASLADAGADIVVGSHSHRLQGAGYLGDTFVSYGLGNFIWYAPPGPTAESGVLYVTAVGRDVETFRFLPADIRNGVPQPLSAEAATSRVATWNDLRTCTDLAASPASS